MRTWGVVATLVFLAFYAAFAGQFSLTEAVTMVIAVAAALALTLAIHRSTEHRFNLRAPWVWLVRRTFVSICRDSVKVGLFLLRSLWRRPPRHAGETYSQPFHFGDDSATEATRRALVSLSVSASPDQYVIEMNPENSLRAHSLVGESGKSDREWPV